MHACHHPDSANSCKCFISQASTIRWLRQLALVLSSDFQKQRKWVEKHESQPRFENDVSYSVMTQANSEKGNPSAPIRSRTYKTFLYH